MKIKPFMQMEQFRRRFFLVAVFLTPLAAMADIADMFFRPPESNRILPEGLCLFVVVGLPLLIGGGLLAWIWRMVKCRASLPKERVVLYWLVWGLVLFAVCIGVSAFTPRSVCVVGCGRHRLPEEDDQAATEHVDFGHDERAGE